MHKYEKYKYFKKKIHIINKDSYNKKEKEKNS